VARQKHRKRKDGLPGAFAVCLQCAFVLAVVVLAAATLSRPHAASAAGSRTLCGVERWTAKTLQDRPVLIPAQKTTIAYLTSRTPPASLLDARLPFERHIFTVTAAVVHGRRGARSSARTPHQ
jgi:hypothetical protein